jgi:hypothetical protein
VSTSNELTSTDVAAGVAQAMAIYTHALDDGRVDDLVAMYCPDGSCVMPGLGNPAGHEELRAAYAKVTPRVPQRHLVFNTVITAWAEHEAHAISDVVFLYKSDAGWVVGVVGRYTDVLHHHGEGWRFYSRTAEFTS